MKKLLLGVYFCVMLGLFSSVGATNEFLKIEPIKGELNIIQTKVTGFTPLAGAALGITCIDCDSQEKEIIEVETAAGPLALGLGAIIAIGAADCLDCIFNEEEEIIEVETTAGPLALGLGAIIAIGAVNIESDEETDLHCKISKIEGKNIECEIVETINTKKITEYHSDDAVMKQGENNDPVPGIDIIIKRETIAGPSTLYRCENGTVVEDSTDCGGQIGMVKYMKIEGSDGLDRIQESLTIANSVHICDDGTQVSLPSECGDTSEYDTIVYVPADDFYRIEGHQRLAGGGVEYFEDQDRLKGANAPCTGPEDTSPGCDGVAAIKIQDGEDRLTENVSLKARGEDRIEESVSIRAEKREEIKEARKDHISAYKGAFVKRIGNRLDKIPTKNLETALEKINTKIEETENNEKMSDAKKESYMDALFALIEIVEDKIDDIKGE